MRYSYPEVSSLSVLMAALPRSRLRKRTQGRLAATTRVSPHSCTPPPPSSPEPFALLIMKAAFTILVALPTVVLAAPAADKVVAFPGLVEPMPSSVYSGYIDAEAGGQKYRSFYVFTEASGPTPPMKAPLLLWQQGGPGSSGLGFGYLAELGPYRLTADSLTQNTTSIPRPFLNPHSFDRLANLLIFEHPPG